jgi:hypothetical protein
MSCVHIVRVMGSFLWNGIRLIRDLYWSLWLQRGFRVVLPTFFCYEDNVLHLTHFHVYLCSVNMSHFITPRFVIQHSKFASYVAVYKGMLELTLNTWESKTGLKQAKGLISGSSARIRKDLLELNRDQLRWMVELFTGHCHLIGHLFKLGLTDDPTGERCLKEDESATHILCDCEAIAYLIFHHLGQFFMEPSVYYGAPISPTFHSKCRIDKGLSYRGNTIDHCWSRRRGRILWPIPHTYIQHWTHTSFCGGRDRVITKKLGSLQ